jgi:hypothetical protein
LGNFKSNQNGVLREKEKEGRKREREEKRKIIA